MIEEKIPEGLLPDENVPEEILNKCDEVILKHRITKNLIAADQIWLKNKVPIWGITFIIMKND